MPADDEALLDAARVHEMAQGCGWTLAEFAAFYADGARKELVALERALEDGDPAALARLAHGAAGSSASAGMIALVPLYRAIENHAAAETPEVLRDRLAAVRDCLEQALAALGRAAGGST